MHLLPRRLLAIYQQRNQLDLKTVLLRVRIANHRQRVSRVGAAGLVFAIGWGYWWEVDAGDHAEAPDVVRLKELLKQFYYK
jgi:hypothetical protein